MNYTDRYLKPSLKLDLRSKMAFVGGPRQVGKTTLALSFLKRPSKTHPAYLNWDRIQDAKRIRDAEIPPKQPLIILDEIHKYRLWRRVVKGFYDTYSPKVSFLVTGSARLDHYRRGGDSLLGRYHYFRLHPFSLGELDYTKATLNDLLRWGGFPEPLFRASEKFWRRWHLERLERVIYEDLRDLEHVKEVDLIQLLAESLVSRVGAPLSIKSLREDLEVSHQSVERWISILENLYYCFRIAPYGAPKIRAVKKEQKLYLWDWSQIEDPGFRFENLVASQLLKYCHYVQDTEGYLMELRFLRDTDQRELDFVVLKDRKPLFAVECKTGERGVSKSAKYFRERTSIKRIYQVHLGTKHFGDEERDVRVLPFIEFCKELQLP